MNTGNGYGYSYGAGQAGYGEQAPYNQQYNGAYPQYYPVQKDPNRGKGAGKIVASSIMSFFLVVFLLVAMLAIFVFALNSDTAFLSFDFFSQLIISLLFASPILMIVVSFFILLMLLIIMLINMHRMRRAMFFIGLSLTVTAVLGMAAGAFSKSIAELLSDEWYSFFIKFTGTFSDYTTVCGIVLIVTGVLFMSLSALVAAAKGGRS